MPEHATGSRAAIQPCFPTLPVAEQNTKVCAVCGAYFTAFTMLHAEAHACTGCMLRTLRPYDYVEKVDA